LDLQLVCEKFSSSSEIESRLYPINAIRNRAISLAKTEAVLLLDVDFMPASGFVLAYQSTPDAYQDIICQLRRKMAMVLPAFEVAELPGGIKAQMATAQEAVRSK
jgi:glycosyltransferase-like protein LARGE